ncbi:MAG: hypothetical protein ACM3NO_03220, partial [Deltaproteobacteria bacterium]
LELLRAHQETVQRLAGLNAITFMRGRLPSDPAVRVGSGIELRLLLEQSVDHGAEKGRLGKERESLERQIAQVKKQLDDQNFMSRAPREVVRGAERRFAELSEHLKKVLDSLSKLN